MINLNYETLINANCMDKLDGLTNIVLQKSKWRSNSQQVQHGVMVQRTGMCNVLALIDKNILYN